MLPSIHARNEKGAMREHWKVNDPIWNNLPFSANFTLLLLYLRQHVFFLYNFIKHCAPLGCVRCHVMGSFCAKQSNDAPNTPFYGIPYILNKASALKSVGLPCLTILKLVALSYLCKFITVFCLISREFTDVRDLLSGCFRKSDTGKFNAAPLRQRFTCLPPGSWRFDTPVHDLRRFSHCIPFSPCSKGDTKCWQSWSSCFFWKSVAWALVLRYMYVRGHYSTDILWNKKNKKLQQ